MLGQRGVKQDNDLSPAKLLSRASDFLPSSLADSCVPALKMGSHDDLPAATTSLVLERSTYCMKDYDLKRYKMYDGNGV